MNNKSEINAVKLHNAKPSLTSIISNNLKIKHLIKKKL